MRACGIAATAGAQRQEGSDAAAHKYQLTHHHRGPVSERAMQDLDV